MAQQPEILRDRGKSLEDEFFHREDQRLLERLRDLRAAEASREALSKASGITQPEVLDRLLRLGIQAHTLAALSIVPLIEVAWADRALDAKERRAVLEHAGVVGITAGSPAYELLEVAGAPPEPAIARCPLEGRDRGARAGGRPRQSRRTGPDLEGVARRGRDAGEPGDPVRDAAPVRGEP